MQLSLKERQLAIARLSFDSEISVRFLNWEMHCCVIGKDSLRQYSTPGQSIYPSLCPTPTKDYITYEVLCWCHSEPRLFVPRPSARPLNMGLLRPAWAHQFANLVHYVKPQTIRFWNAPYTACSLRIPRIAGTEWQDWKLDQKHRRQSMKKTSHKKTPL